MELTHLHMKNQEQTKTLRKLLDAQLGIHCSDDALILTLENYVTGDRLVDHCFPGGAS